jgi:hypothetical protein
VLLLVALWPIAHRQLVTRFDVNPWKLYGFAMYCTPHGLSIELIDRSQPQLRKLDPASLPPRARLALDRFAIRRGTLGKLQPPDAMAREVLRALPEVRNLSVAVTVVSLPAGASHVAPRTEIYGYTRDALR